MLVESGQFRSLQGFKTNISFLLCRKNDVFSPFLHLQPIKIPFLSSTVELLDLKMFPKCYEKNTLAIFSVNDICFVLHSPCSYKLPKPCQWHGKLNYI